MFCKKGVLRSFSKFTGKHLCQSLFLNKITRFGPVEKDFVYVNPSIPWKLKKIRFPRNIINYHSLIGFTAVKQIYFVI